MVLTQFTKVYPDLWSEYQKVDSKLQRDASIFHISIDIFNI